MIQKTKKVKIYLKKTLNDGLGYHADIEDKHITLRFAGKPTFILESYQEKYGKDEGAARYHEYLTILNDISDKGFSPFVLYINDNNKKQSN